MVFGGGFVNEMTFDTMGKFLAGLSPEKQLEYAVGLIRQVALPVEKVDLCLFPCSGKLNTMFIPYLFAHPDAREAVNKLIL